MSINTAKLPITCYEKRSFRMRRPLVRPSRDNFAHNLAELMAERKLSDVALGRLIERSGAAVGRWRQGIQEPSFEIKDSIAKALGVSVSRLYVDPTDEKSTGIPLDTALRIVTAAIKDPDLDKALRLVSEAVKEKLK